MKKFQTAYLSRPAKFIGFLVLSLTGFILVAGFLMVDQYLSYQKTKRMESLVHLSVYLGNFIHEVQKERGLSAGFLGTAGVIFQDPLEKQRRSVQARMDKLEIMTHAADFSVYGNQIHTNLLSLLKELKDIETIRDAVDNYEIGPLEVIDRYSKINQTMLHTIPSTRFLSHDPRIPRVSLSFFNFLHFKEAVGIERAILANTFAEDSFSFGMRDKLLVLQGEGSSHLEFFLSLSSPALGRLYQEALSGSVPSEVNRLRSLALAHTGQRGFGVDATAWFEVATQRIDRFQSIEERLERELLAVIADVLKTSRNTFWFYVLCSFVLFGAVVVLISSAILNATRNMNLEREIAGRKLLEKKLVKAKERAEENDRAKSNFLASMSHEIRTPLNIVIGLNEHLLDTEDDPARSHYLELAKRAGENLLALINNILDLSKIEANQLELESMSFNLPDLVRKTTKMVDYPSREKGLDISVHLASDIPSNIIGDSQRLMQILINLLGNAIKFTDVGEVTVSVKRGDKDEIHFMVSDTGMGIPEEKWKRIFSPFTQSDNATTRRFGGTGLGLDICQKLVSLMGGRIWVESQVGKGSQFHFTCPFPEGGGERRVLEKRLYDRDGIDGPVRSLQILLAEDVVESVTVIQAFLGETPHRLDRAENGVQAVERFQSGKYDLVLMDVQMPIMDGFTATRKIRAWEKEHARTPTPILALTAHALHDVATQILEAGCDLHLTKPISKSRLLDIIGLFASNGNKRLGKGRDSHTVLTYPKKKDRAGTTSSVPPPVSPSVQNKSTEKVESLNIFTMDKLRKGMGGHIGPIQQFLKNLPQRISDISSTVSDQAPDRLETQAHKLKGTARMFGADRLATLSWKLEAMGKKGMLPEDDTVLDDLKEEALNVEQMISSYLENLNS